MCNPLVLICQALYLASDLRLKTRNESRIARNRYTTPKELNRAGYSARMPL